MKKRLILSLLMCGLLFSCNGKKSNNANSEETSDKNQLIETSTKEENEEGFAFYLQEDGTYAFSIGNAIFLSTITVPSTYKGKRVTKIIDYAFNVSGTTYLPQVKNIFISEGIEEIGEYAFDNENIENVSLPKSILEIKEYAFTNCKLKKIEYAGTYDEFSKITFKDYWLNLNESLENELIFKFQDDERAFNSLATHIYATTYDYGRRLLTEHNKFTLHSGVQEERTIGITKAFGSLNLGRYPSIMSVNTDNDEMIQTQRREGFSFKTTSIYSMQIDITADGFSLSFVCEIVEYFEITVNEMYSSQTSTPFETVSSVDYYLVEGYLCKIDLSSNDVQWCIKDNLTDDNFIYYGDSDEYFRSCWPGFTEEDHIKARIRFVYYNYSLRLYSFIVVSLEHI